MNAATLGALKGSIEKWEAIVAGTGEDRGWRNCPLCLMFNTDEMAQHDGDKTCIGCPVMERTGYRWCDESPYLMYKAAPIADHAQAELDFLRSLLPSESV